MINQILYKHFTQKRCLFWVSMVKFIHKRDKMSIELEMQTEEQKT